MQIVLFTIVATALYFFSDFLLKEIERRRGAPLPHRSLIFLLIIGTLAVVTFEGLQWYLQQQSNPL